ncbi:hypothetical protein [Sciscionella sediminilitoris]|uniref:hypothetical protein n=1 Tax=Sciscionella sediminilitoris TaxID=1445613 RepID=UPI0004DFB5CA|nr:hypothetical protein [Sciscionella sp. SE31]
MNEWSEVLVPLDDQVSVERCDLIVVLRWLEEQHTPMMVSDAELRLRQQLMALADETVPHRNRGHAVRVALAVCSALVLIGVGIAWLLLGAT